MARFRERFDATLPPPRARRCSTRCWRATASGAARRSRRTIAHRRLPRRADLERVPDPAGALRAASACRPIVCDPRDLEFDGAHAPRRRARAIDLVYRRVLINDIVAAARRLPRARGRLRGAAPCASPTRSAARSRTRRRSSPCSPTSATPGCFTDERARGRRGARAVDARRAPTRGRPSTAGAIDLLEHRARRARVVRHQAERRVRRRRASRSAGRRRPADWDAAIERALAVGRRVDRAAADRRAPRGVPDRRERPHRVDVHATCWSTSRRTCSAASVAGFLTRLSATGLANVTSGGGQVPSFVVSPSATRGSAVRR